MRVRRATLHALELPFRERFVHGTQARAASDAVVVRVEGADGAVGHGEGLARPYVTGETTDGLVARVRDVLWPAVRGAELPAEPAELLGAIDALLPPSAPSGAEREAGVVAHHAARCAVELALLDAGLRSAGRGAAAALPPATDVVRYGGAVGLVAPDAAARLAERIAALGLGDVKVKVGDADGVARVAAVREVLGPDVALRVDANGTWGLARAAAEATALAELGVEALEEPLGRARRADLPALVERCELPVILDESLVTAADADLVAELGPCVWLDVRLSKCGGLAAALALAASARARGHGLVVGCQVGETAISSAAGRHLAAHLPEHRRLEGSFGTLLLAEDVAEPEVRFGAGGRAPLLAGRGLGVDVLEERLERWTARREELA